MDVMTPMTPSPRDGDLMTFRLAATMTSEHTLKEPGGPRRGRRRGVPGPAPPGTAVVLPLPGLAPGRGLPGLRAPARGPGWIMPPGHPRRRRRRACTPRPGPPADGHLGHPAPRHRPRGRYPSRQPWADPRGPGRRAPGRDRAGTWSPALGNDVARFPGPGQARDALITAFGGTGAVPRAAAWYGWLNARGEFGDHHGDSGRCMSPARAVPAQDSSAACDKMRASSAGALIMGQ